MRIFVIAILFLNFHTKISLLQRLNLSINLKYFNLSFYFVTLFCSSWLYSQEKLVPTKTLIESRIQEGVKFKQISPFQRDTISSEQADLLSLKNNSLDILKKGENDVHLQINSELIHDLELLLTKVNPLDENFFFQTSDGQKIIPQNVFFYRGIIKGSDDSKVTLTVRENFIRAHIVSGNESYILGQMSNRFDKYVLMDEKFFSEESGLVCEYSDDLLGNPKPPLQSDISMTSFSSVSKKVSIYFETDFNLYQKLGSTTLNTQNYVLSMFNELATVYSGIGLTLNLSSTFIWTTTDPYATLTTTSDMLTAFRNNRINVVGDLAHLLSGKWLGGVAYLGSLCTTYKFGVSASQGGNPSTLPRNSFTLIVVAHELGHNLGSPHTHACSWNGNNTRIDDCGGFSGNVEGTCVNPTDPFLPARGTIMSYCHLVSGVGSYYEFHPQVATRISNYVSSVGCLTESSCTNQNITLPNSILGTGIYGTHLNIISASIIQVGSNVQMTASQSITLKPGFLVQAGSTFSAKIQSCLSEPLILPLQREASIYEDFTVYPNPFQQGFTVTFSLAENEKGILQVTSLHGQLMIARIVDNNWGQKNHQEDFPLENLVPGIYIISLQTNQRNIHKKIIKAD